MSQRKMKVHTLADRLVFSASLGPMRYELRRYCVLCVCVCVWERGVLLCMCVMLCAHHRVLHRVFANQRKGDCSLVVGVNDSSTHQCVISAGHQTSSLLRRMWNWANWYFLVCSWNIAQSRNYNFLIGLWMHGYTMRRLGKTNVL